MKSHFFQKPDPTAPPILDNLKEPDLPLISAKDIDTLIQKVKPNAYKGLYRAGVEAGIKLIREKLKQ